MTLQDQCNEAEAAYHRLMTGQQVVKFTDSNGQNVEYTAINASKLAGYIADLKRQLADKANAGPLRVWL